MEFKQVNKKLLWIFVFVVILRLVFALSTPYFDGEYSYFHLRQVEDITENFSPTFSDDLSYGGRSYVFLPLMHYFLAIFLFIFKFSIILKIITNLVAASLVFVIYGIIKQLTDNENVSLLIAFLSAFIPIYIESTLHSLTTLSFIMPLSFLLFYTLIKTNKKKYQYVYLFSFVLLMFIDASTIFLLFIFIVYFLLLKLEDIKLKQSEKELFLFSLFFLIWVYVLFFKNVLLTHNINLIWKNVPTQIIADYFKNITTIEALYKIGIVPFIVGLYMMYFFLFKKIRKNNMLFVSIVLTSGILVYLRWLSLEMGLAYIGITFMIMFGVFIDGFTNYIEKTKFDRYKKYLATSLIVLLVLTSIIPSLFFAWRNTIKTEDQFFAPFSVIDQFSDEGSTIISSPYNGHPITYYSGRENVMDTNYLLVENIDERYNDVKTIYQTHVGPVALNLLNKYSVDFIYLSDIERAEFGIDNLYYIDSPCFEKIPLGDSILYENLCGDRND